jgi:hypothetical protein
MMQNYKYFILSIFLSLWVTIGRAQTPQLHFILDANETGAAKSYVARDYITLKSNFRYTASANQSFTARIDKTIDIKLPDGTVIKLDGTQTKPDGTIVKPDGTIVKPDGTQIKPDGTQLKLDGTIIKPDGTQTKPDGTIIRHDGTIYKTDGTIINPDGTLLDISLIIPEVWFKTIPVTGNTSGRYKWKDFSSNNVPLVKYSTNGTSTEYTVGRDSVMNYNFNPAIDLTAGNISKEIVIGKSNLAQATIIGAWASKNEVTDADKFIFALNGRQNESIVFSKSNVYPSIESGKNALPYGNDTIKNLLCQPNSNTSAKKARENSLRIASYYKSNRPNTSLWGEQQKATISLGSSFSNSNANNTSTFISTLNDFEGFKGYTPELFVFGRILQPVEREIFESYLAIKYGVSMNKSYLSGKGKVIWDYSSNTSYNNRITGYGREDLIGLNQKVATTSYQEAPYYSDFCDSYQANSANTLSARNRLLVMGCQLENPINDGEYVLFGDDNNPLNATNTSTPGFVTMQRKWLVNTNRTSTNRIELSYFDSLATGFSNHQNETYLIVDRTGSGTFNSLSDVYLMDSLDTDRSKIIFKNIVWNTDRNNVFTFGYKVLNKVKKNTTLESTSLDTLDPVSDLRIYYTDPHDMSSITVKLQTAKPTTSVIMVVDMSGRIIFRQNLPESINVQFTNIKLPISGIYLIKVINNEITYTQKMISKN